MTPGCDAANPPPLRRLHSRAQFQAVLAAATVARSAHFALHRLSIMSSDNAVGATASTPSLFDGPRGPWIGVVLPRRWARRAVTRNVIRRQVYALAQARLLRLASAAHVVRLRAGFDPKRWQSASSQDLKRTVRSELERLFDGART